ncbi:uncharacterized protein OCT59_019284 [Rhizophagus irregularis]|uniref:uncharacterized protein n=1 Tax=Rhizophagus irregularis TaxID=588596 RepID=UPI00331FC95F|nr:hypothetical protein OCT59_019284 [Rhizophagus irregularis]
MGPNLLKLGNTSAINSGFHVLQYNVNWKQIKQIKQYFDIRILIRGPTDMELKLLNPRKTDRVLIARFSWFLIDNTYILKQCKFSFDIFKWITSLYALGHAYEKEIWHLLSSSRSSKVTRINSLKTLQIQFELIRAYLLYNLNKYLKLHHQNDPPKCVSETITSLKKGIRSNLKENTIPYTIPPTKPTNLQIYEPTFG